MRTEQESAKYREGSKATAAAAAGQGQEGKRQKKKGESSASLTELSVNCVVAAILLPMPLWGEMLSGFGLLSEQATQREKGPRKIRQIHVENQISFPVRINMISAGRRPYEPLSRVTNHTGHITCQKWPR